MKKVKFEKGGCLFRCRTVDERKRKKMVGREIERREAGSEGLKQGKLTAGGGEQQFSVACRFYGYKARERCHHAPVDSDMARAHYPSLRDKAGGRGKNVRVKKTRLWSPHF